MVRQRQVRRTALPTQALSVRVGSLALTAAVATVGRSWPTNFPSESHAVDIAADRIKISSMQLRRLNDRLDLAGLANGACYARLKPCPFDWESRSRRVDCLGMLLCKRRGEFCRIAMAYVRRVASHTSLD